MERFFLSFFLRHQLGMWQVDLFLMKAQWSQTKDILGLNEPESESQFLKLPLLAKNEWWKVIKNHSFIFGFWIPSLMRKRDEIIKHWMLLPKDFNSSVDSLGIAVKKHFVWLRTFRTNVRVSFLISSSFSFLFFWIIRNLKR